MIFSLRVTVKSKLFLLTAKRGVKYFANEIPETLSCRTIRGVLWRMVKPLYRWLEPLEEQNLGF